MSSHSRYIVVFKKHASAEQIQSTRDSIAETGGKVTHEYGTVLNGFAAEIEPTFFQELQSSIDDNSAIDYIEPDGEVTIQ